MVKNVVLARAGWLTYLVAGLCCLATLLTQAGQNEWTQLFVLQWSLVAEGQWWRLFTPIFLHFPMWGSTILHLAFNVLWWIVVGGAVERFEGWGRLLGLLLVSALVSNVVAFWVYGAFFGGLSGVCYALVGYVGERALVVVRYKKVVDRNLLMVFVGMMVLGFTGILGAVANMAHLAGFFVGILWALGLKGLNK